LEVTFIRWPAGEEAVHGDIWDHVDEQPLPPELRRRLAANGLRCGLAGMRLPDAVVQRLANRGAAAGGDGSPTNGSDPAYSPMQQRRLQSRSGHRSEIVTSRSYDELPVIVEDEGRVQGQWYQQAQCLLSVKTYPLDDGRLRVVLTPELQYGQPQQRWVGGDGGFRLEAGRDRKTFGQLRIETHMALGQSLLMSCTPEVKGLGRHFFTEHDAGAPWHKLLLIRLAQTQLDDLSAAREPVAPLVTGLE
jgi:hypothetical protein